MRFIISVTNSGKWLGYADMTELNEAVNLGEENETNLSPAFGLKWIKTVKGYESGRGVSFVDTEMLLNKLDSNKTVNLSRNGQQIEKDVAMELCRLIDLEVEKEEEERKIKYGLGLFDVIA